MSIKNPYLKLTRPINCVMGGVGVFIGSLIGVGLDINLFFIDVTIAVLVMFIFMAGANALNDYYDRKTDKINHPERPIPSGQIHPKTALNFAVSALLISVILSIFLNITAFLIVCTAALLIILYEIRFKNEGLVGNIIISLLVALIFIFGGAVVNTIRINIILAGMAFFATLGREIVKDIEDIKGDIDRLTLPKRIGIRNAAAAASFFIIIAVLISPIPYFNQFFPYIQLEQVISIQYLILIVIADMIFLNSITDIKTNPKQASNLLKYGMITALIAFLMVALF